MPKYFGPENASQYGTKTLDVRTLRLVVAADHSMRTRPEHFDSSKQVLSQLRPSRDSTSQGVEVVSASGAVLGMLVFERHGTNWATIGGVYGDAAGWYQPLQAAAELRLKAALGGSIDETAVVDYWVLARRGSREAGMIWHEPTSRTAAGTLTPRVDTVYYGADLARRFGAYAPPP